MNKDIKIDTSIGSRIIRKNIVLFNAFTIARIGVEPAKNLTSNGITLKTEIQEKTESTNENIDNSSNKELRYSKEFINFLETLPNATILKHT